MLLVPTRVLPSPIEGVGLFARAPIPKGTPVWEYRPPFDLALPPESLASLPDVARRLVYSHGYLFNADGIWYLNMDDARFINHAARPSLVEEGDYMVAARDLAAGEELTSNYFTYYTPNPHQAWLETLPRG